VSQNPLRDTCNIGGVVRAASVNVAENSTAVTAITATDADARSTRT
jgi:hypothetical protein